MSKFGFDYFVKKAELLSEMARPISHRLMNDTLTGEKMTIFNNLKTPILNKIYRGKSKDGQPLTDSEGKPAHAIVTSPDDRYNKWLLMKLIEASDTDDIALIEPTPESVERIMDSPIGSYLEGKFGEDAEKKAYNLLKSAQGSDIIPQAYRIMINNTLADGKDYFTDFKGKDPVSGNQLLKTAMMLIVRKHPDILTNKEFLSLLDDDTSLADFMNGKRTIVDSGHSVKSAINRLDKLGIPIKSDEGDPEGLVNYVHNVDGIINAVLPLLNALNKEHGYKHGKRISGFERRKSGDISPKKEAAPVVQNLDTDTAVMVSALLKQFNRQFTGIRKMVEDNSAPDIEGKIENVADDLHLDPSYVTMLVNSNLGVVKTLIDFVGKRIEGGSGLSMDSFNKMLDSIEQAYSGDPKIKNIIEVLRNHIRVSSDIKNTVQREDSQGMFKGFDENILEKVLDTPQKMKLFSKWYRTIFLPIELSNLQRDISAAMGEISKNQAGERRAFDQFTQAKVNAKGQPVDRSTMRWEPEFADIKKELESKPRSEWSAYDMEMAKKVGLLKDEEVTPEKEAEAFGMLKGKLQKESYVMDYMTEQVSKDKFKPRGEFKERGFKKPINYAHWLDINK